MEAHKPNDFFAFHSFSRFIQLYPPSLIYDNDLLGSLQVQLQGKPLPYLYHPGMLLLLWPLAYLPYKLSYLFWMGTGLSVYLIAVGIPGRNRAAILAALVAPSTALVLICGQSGLLAAGLLFGGFRLLPRKPFIAGVLFGLLSYKPQLGILVPVALVASSQWRAIAAAGTTVVLVIVGSAAAFGWSVWAAWLEHLPSINRLISQNLLLLCDTMATVTANLVVFGLTPEHAHLLQIAVSLCAVIVVWCCFRHGSSMLGAAAVAVATFLTTPYAFGYDMPVLTAAIIVICNERWQSSDNFVFLEVIILITSFLLPFCVISPLVFRFSSLIVLILLCLIAHRIWMRHIRTVVITELPSMIHGIA